MHLVTDQLGRVLNFVLTPGQRGDAPVAEGLLEPLPIATHLLADAAYDSNALRQFLLARGTTPVIPNNPTRKRTHPFDRTLYRARNAIERTVGRLKDWRRVHTRYDKLAPNYASAVAIATLLTCWC